LFKNYVRFFCLLTVKPSGYVSFIIGLHNCLKHDCWLLNYSLGNLVVFLIFPHKFGCCCTIQLVSKGDSSGYKVAFMMAFKSSWWAFYPCVAHMANKPLVWRQRYFSSSLFPFPSLIFASNPLNFQNINSFFSLQIRSMFFIIIYFIWSNL